MCKYTILTLYLKNELLLFIKRHTDASIKKTMTKLHETLEFKMIKQMEIFRLMQQKNS